MSYYIVGIDPSTVCTGVSFFEIDGVSQEILSITTEKIIPINRWKDDPLRIQTSSAKVDVLTRCQYIREQLYLILKHALESGKVITKVGLEVPYMDSNHPGSYRPLITNINEIIDKIFKPLNLSYVEVTPCEGKKIFGVACRGGTTKEDMYSALLTIPELIKYIPNPRGLVDDEVDAIAIGYFTLKG